jgi:hypothetical protein
MHYLIFIPNKTGPNRQNLQDVGLGDLLRAGDMPLWMDLSGNGPGDLPGQVWTWPSGAAIPAYLPDQQTWTCHGPYWLGTWNSNRATPKELLRNELVDGPVADLADGQSWGIPNLTKLPAVFALDSEFKPIKVPHPKFGEFVGRCAWATEAVIQFLETRQAPDWAAALEFCAQALAINYRVNLQIAVTLGLFNEKLLPRVMMFAADSERILNVLEDVKKKDAALTPAG